MLTILGNIFIGLVLVFWGMCILRDLIFNNKNDNDEKTKC